MAPAKKSKKTTKKVTKNSKAKQTKTATKVKKTDPVVKKTETAPVTQTANKNDEITIKKNYLYVAGLVVVGLALAGGYLWQRQQVVATVNGSPISRQEYISQMEAQVGAQVLDNMITQQLIADAMADENVVVPQEEIDEEIAQVSEQFTQEGQSLEDLLAMQGMTLDQLKEDIRIQKGLYQLAGVTDEVSQEEIDLFLEDNQESLPDISEEELQDLAREQVLNQQTQTAVQDYLAALRAQANIVNNQ